MTACVWRVKFNCRNLHSVGENNGAILCQGQLQGNIPQAVVGIQSFSKGHSFYMMFALFL